MNCSRRQMLIRITGRRPTGSSSHSALLTPSLFSAVPFPVAPTGMISALGHASLFSRVSATQATPLLSLEFPRASCTACTGSLNDSRPVRGEDSGFHGNSWTLSSSVQVSTSPSTIQKQSLSARSHQQFIRTACHGRRRGIASVVEDVAESSRGATESCEPIEATIPSASLSASLDGTAENTGDTLDLSSEQTDAGENEVIHTEEGRRKQTRPRIEGDRGWWYGAMQQAFQREIREWFVQKKQGTLFHIWRAPGVVFSSTKLVKSGFTPPPLPQWYFPVSVGEQQVKCPPALQSLFRLNRNQKAGEGPQAPGAARADPDEQRGSDRIEKSFPVCSLFFLSSSKSSAGFLMQQVVLHPETLYVAVTPDYDSLFTLLRLATRAFCMDPCSFQPFPNLRVLCTHPLHAPSFFPDNLVNEVHIHLSELPRAVESRSTSRCPLLASTFLPQLYPRLQAGANIFIGLEMSHASPGFSSRDREMSSCSCTHRSTEFENKLEVSRSRRLGETCESAKTAGDSAVRGGQKRPQTRHVDFVFPHPLGAKDGETPSSRDCLPLWDPDAHLLHLLRATGCVSGLEAARGTLSGSLRVSEDACLYRTGHNGAGRAASDSRKSQTETGSGGAYQRKRKEFLFSMVECDRSGDIEEERFKMTPSLTGSGRFSSCHNPEYHLGDFSDRKKAEEKESPIVSTSVHDAWSSGGSSEVPSVSEEHSLLNQERKTPDEVSKDESAMLFAQSRPGRLLSLSIPTDRSRNQLQAQAFEAAKDQILPAIESDGWLGKGPFVPTWWSRLLPVSQIEPRGTAKTRNTRSDDLRPDAACHGSGKPKSDTERGMRRLRLASGGLIIIREGLGDDKTIRIRSRQQLISHTDRKALLHQSGMEGQAKLLDDTRHISRNGCWSTNKTTSGVSVQYVKLRKLAPSLPNFRFLEHCL
ncbi:hypothetical protein TGME49_210490 [Toxoplasma gondii ME49]|uniref:Uncharacterized protein n=1 Tax=Toxoplasma gondii (strain ATCC 50611 / Me49) TaxID=508771 RepID=S8EXG4_TOXGM|nr:hypothetical protein TGME49_210490 [Toxoplasma gondii ME49]EPT28151.1 hypothetical protein TGME49_210490 [Toxoplasma gondii ME49]|eukprot:XP_018636498.1 hypothetical protein TGME49_210490 [Toxoplasma gondii ME49]